MASFTARVSSLSRNVSSQLSDTGANASDAPVHSAGTFIPGSAWPLMAVALGGFFNRQPGDAAITHAATAAARAYPDVERRNITTPSVQADAVFDDDVVEIRRDAQQYLPDDVN